MEAGEAEPINRRREMSNGQGIDFNLMITLKEPGSLFSTFDGLGGMTICLSRGSELCRPNTGRTKRTPSNNQRLCLQREVN